MIVLQVIFGNLRFKLYYKYFQQLWRHLSTVRQPVVNSRSGKVLAKSEARVSLACSQSEVSSECLDQSEASIDLLAAARVLDCAAGVRVAAQHGQPLVRPAPPAHPATLETGAGYKVAWKCLSTWCAAWTRSQWCQVWLWARRSGPAPCRRSGAPATSSEVTTHAQTAATVTRHDTLPRE